MKCKSWLVLVLSLLLSGCGDIDWFPETASTTTSTDNSNLTAPTIRASVSPTSIVSGGNSTLTLTILNKTGNPAQTGMAFVELLPTGVTATVANNAQCGGDVSVLASGTKIVLINGSLAAGAANCSISATLSATNSGATAQSFVIKSSDFSNLQGGLVAGVTDQTLTVTPVPASSPALSASIVPAAMVDGGSSTLTLTINNSTGSPAQSGINFVEAIPAGFKATVATASQCGGNLAVSGSNLIFTGGQLASGVASCALNADLSLAVSNSITSDQTFSVKNTDFGSFQGTLTNGVTDQTFKVFPSAVTAASGGVTVSNLVAAGFSDGALPTVNFTFNADTANSNASDITATVTVAGIDNSGATITSTQTPLSVSIPAGLLTSQVLLNSTPVAVPSADNANIAFWRLLSVTVP